ncbi:MAG: hypothetical protein AAFZ87_01890, partial [Planctomycetota bacterium]
ILFQDGRLFPHLTVQQNLAYADQRSRSDQDRYTANQVVDAFDLAGLLPRRPDSSPAASASASPSRARCCSTRRS